MNNQHDQTPGEHVTYVGTITQPMHVVFKNGITIGLFFNKLDHKKHLAQYTPFREAPRKYLCNQTGEFSIWSGNLPLNYDAICPVCLAKLEEKFENITGTYWTYREILAKNQQKTPLQCDQSTEKTPLENTPLF